MSAPHLDRGGWRWLYRHLGIGPMDGPGTRDLEVFSRAVLLDAGPQLPHLLGPLVRAGIHDADPSFNRWHIEPALYAFGTRRVYEACLEYLENGTPFEIAGAAAALYWVEAIGARLVYLTSKDEPTPASKAVHDAVADLRQRKDLAMLRAFIENEDVEVRRYTLPYLRLDDPSIYPEDARHLLDDVIAIARAHPDDYIRHRLAVQLHEELTLQPIPNRADPRR